MDHYGYTGDEKRDRRNRRELTTVSMYELKTHLDCLTEFHGSKLCLFCERPRRALPLSTRAVRMAPCGADF